MIYIRVLRKLLYVIVSFTFVTVGYSNDYVIIKKDSLNNGIEEVNYLLKIVDSISTVLKKSESITEIDCGIIESLLESLHSKRDSFINNYGWLTHPSLTNNLIISLKQFEKFIRPVGKLPAHSAFLCGRLSELIRDNFAIQELNMLVQDIRGNILALNSQLQLKITLSQLNLIGDQMNMVEVSLARDSLFKDKLYNLINKIDTTFSDLRLSVLEINSRVSSLDSIQYERYERISHHINRKNNYIDFGALILSEKSTGYSISFGQTFNLVSNRIDTLPYYSKLSLGWQLNSHFTFFDNQSEAIIYPSFVIAPNSYNHFMIGTGIQINSDQKFSLRLGWRRITTKSLGFNASLIAGNKWGLGLGISYRIPKL